MTEETEIWGPFSYEATASLSDLSLDDIAYTGPGKLLKWMDEVDNSSEKSIFTHTLTNVDANAETTSRRFSKLQLTFPSERIFCNYTRARTDLLSGATILHLWLDSAHQSYEHSSFGTRT